MTHSIETQREIFRLAAKGTQERAIAALLDVSRGAVRCILRRGYTRTPTRLAKQRFHLADLPECFGCPDEGNEAACVRCRAERELAVSLGRKRNGYLLRLDEGEPCERSELDTPENRAWAEARREAETCQS